MEQQIIQNVVWQWQLLVLGGCGGSEQGGNTTRRRIGFGRGKFQRTHHRPGSSPVAVSRELETSTSQPQRGEDSENPTNLVDGLLEVDEKVNWFLVSQKNGELRTTV